MIEEYRKPEAYCEILGFDPLRGSGKPEWLAPIELAADQNIRAASSRSQNLDMVRHERRKDALMDFPASQKVIELNAGPRRRGWR